MNENPPVIISIASGKGGVGKTCIALNLATALAAHDKRVLLVDCDLGLANVDIMLGLNPQKNLKDVIFEDADIREVIVKTGVGFDFAPASSGMKEMATLLNDHFEKLKEAIAQVSEGYDYVFLDIGAGISDTVIRFNLFAERNIVVVTKDLTSIADAYAMMKTIYRTFGKRAFEIIVNSTREDNEGIKVFNQIGSMCDKFLGFSPRYLGSISLDDAVSQSIRRQSPLVHQFPDSKASKEMSLIASRIHTA